MPDVFWVSVVSVAVLAVFALGAVIKWREIRRFRGWSTTEGKIISARSVFQSNNPYDSNYDSSDSEILNVPHIHYEYRVGEESFRGSQVSLVVKDPRYLSARSTLSRYPAGKIVPVYFDPQNPANAALERNFTRSDYVTFGWLLVVCLLVPWLIAVFLCQVHLRIQPRIVDAGAAKVATGIIGFATVFLVLAVGSIATVLKSWLWLVTTGRIKSSSVDSFHVHVGDTYHASFKPRVLYTYEVCGQRYTGDRIFFSFTLGGMSERKAKRIAARYPKKSPVRVYYNPRRPDESVLRRSGAVTLLFPIIAAVLFGIAWAMAQ